MSEPWYHKGLKFACTGCGDCCTGEPGYVWVNKREIEAMAAAMKLSVEVFEREYVRTIGIRKSLIEYANGDCVFFNNQSRHCRIYSARPRQCRTWPFWPSNLASPAAWEEVKQRCPGCSRGRVVPLEKILAQLEVVRV
jgi:uncharacterized protein